MSKVYDCGRTLVAVCCYSCMAVLIGFSWLLQVASCMFYGSCNTPFITAVPQSQLFITYLTVLTCLYACVLLKLEFPAKNEIRCMDFAKLHEDDQTEASIFITERKLSPHQTW
jgi:hypothetical protein